MKPLESLNHGFESTTHVNGSFGGNTCDFTNQKNNGQKVYPFVYDFQINDLPEPVRNLLIKQVTLEEISCYSGTNIKVLGSFVPTERKDNQLGLKPLYLHIQASKKQNIDRAVQRIKVQIQQAMNLPKYKEKVLIGLEAAPAAFDVRGKVLGPGGANLQYITNETGAIVTLRGRGSGFIEPTTGLESIEPLHLCVEHNKYDVLQSGRQLAFNLIETVQQEWYNYNSQQQNQPNNNSAVPQHMTQQPGWKEKSSESRFNKDYSQSSKRDSKDLYNPGEESDRDDDEYSSKRSRKHWNDRGYKKSSSIDQFQRSGTSKPFIGNSSQDYSGEEISSGGRNKKSGGMVGGKSGKWKENGFDSKRVDGPNVSQNFPSHASSGTVPSEGIQSGLGPVSQPDMGMPMGSNMGIRSMGVTQPHAGGSILVVGPQGMPLSGTPMAQGGAGGFMPNNSLAVPLSAGSNNILVMDNNQFYPPVSNNAPSQSLAGVFSQHPADAYTINVAIVSEMYPDKSVTRECFDRFLDRLNTLIMQVDPKRDSVYPAFKSVKLECGVICAICKSEETRMWLEKVLPLCTIDWDVGLKIKDPVYLPNLALMITKLNGPKPSPEMLLKQLGNQNSNINTSLWSVANINETEQGCWAVFSVDESQRNILLKSNLILNYRFEEISLRQLDGPKPHNWFGINQKE